MKKMILTAFALIGLSLGATGAYAAQTHNTNQHQNPYSTVMPSDGSAG
jgi:hypothetical protein